MKQQLVERVDFYYDKTGLMVLTEKYHIDKGFCCGNGCRHCPYNYENVPEPKRSEIQPHPNFSKGEGFTTLE